MFSDCRSGDRRSTKRHRRYASKRVVREFDGLPLWRRRKAAVSARNEIRQCRDGGGVFSTYDLLPGSVHAGKGEIWPCGWADVIFLGNDRGRKGRLWNATVLSSPMDAIERLQGQAMDAAMSEARENGFPEFSSFSERGNIADFLGGVSLEEWMSDWIRRGGDHQHLLRSGAEIERGYVYGTGLILVVPVAGLTVSNVNQAIRGFLDGGERVGLFKDGVSADVRSMFSEMVDHEIWIGERARAERLGEPAPEPRGESSPFVNALVI